MRSERTVIGVLPERDNMSYQAIHYVKIDGHVYAPGEIVKEHISSEKLDRLLRLGALATTNAPSLVPVGNEDPENPEEDSKPDENDEDNGSAPEIDVSDGIVPQKEPTEGAEVKKPKKLGK